MYIYIYIHAYTYIYIYINIYIYIYTCLHGVLVYSSGAEPLVAHTPLPHRFLYNPLFLSLLSLPKAAPCCSCCYSCYYHCYPDALSCIFIAYPPWSCCCHVPHDCFQVAKTLHAKGSGSS